MKSIRRRDHSTSSSSSITSSTDSSSNYQNNHPNLGSQMKSSLHLHLPTDLSLGLTISGTTPNFSPSVMLIRQQAGADWPPIKALLRRTLITAEEERNITTPQSPVSSSSCQQMLRQRNSSDHSFFVKVVVEGIRIGRKIDLSAIHGYPHLVTTLEDMFTIPNILWAGLEEEYSDVERWSSHVLIYEDQDGDWMMVGDVPWEMFLTTVKKLKITRTISYT